MRVDARVVVPTQKFSVNANPALVGTNPYDTYMIPSAAVKFNITDNFAVRRHLDAERRGGCRILRPRNFPSGKVSENFHTDEFGAACAVRFEVGRGVISVIGGGFVEQLDYERVTDLNFPTGGLLPPGTNANLSLDGQEYGWRGGLAYEIPEYKLRAQILYRSGTDYGATGTLTVPGALVGAPVPSVDIAGGGHRPAAAER